MNIKLSYYASPLLDPKKHYFVRISVGRPRFFKHKIDAVDLDLAPTREMLAGDVSASVYTRQYRKRLAALGVAEIKERFATLTRQAGDKETVLLCFEKPDYTLGTDNFYCHRQLLAQWWREQTGQVLEELKAEIAFDTLPLFTRPSNKEGSSPDTPTKV